MEIKVGKYTLKSDRYSMYVEEDYEDKNGKNQTKMVAGYCTTFEKLIEDFMDKQLKESDAKSMEEAIKVIEKATQDAKAMLKAAAENNFRIIRHKEK